MSTRILVKACSVAFITLTVSGAALARRPPALVEEQRAAQQAIATCPAAPALSGGGYRDMHARLDREGAERDATAFARLLRARRLGTDHWVAVCDGNRVNLPSGYRGLLDRIAPEGQPVLQARKISSGAF